jgi:putative ABC transport system permease protein
LAGVNETFSDMRNFVPDHGRWLTKRDCDELRRVCVIGNEVRKKLFGEDADPLNKTMLINGREFLIVGWKSDKKQDWYYSSGPDNQLVYIPWTTHTAMFDNRWFGNFVFAPYNVADHDLAVKEFKTILGKVHRFDPEDKEAVNMWDTLQQAKETGKLFDAINYLLIAIGGITLMIGGLGVMNIMIVAVIERTREIGIRRAIGAKRGTIIRQFFYECLVITIIAGGAGMLVGWGLIRLLSKVKLPQGFPSPAMSQNTMFIAVLLIGVVTIFSGLYPAIRAARVNPIEALRHE